MGTFSKIGRVVHLGTFPETRGLLKAAIVSEELRVLAGRAFHDKRGLTRDAADPRRVVAFALNAARHPATRELADAGMLFLPGRYLALGWLATSAGRRLVRGHGSARRRPV